MVKHVLNFIQDGLGNVNLRQSGTFTTLSENPGTSGITVGRVALDVPLSADFPEAKV